MDNFRLPKDIIDVFITLMNEGDSVSDETENTLITLRKSTVGGRTIYASLYSSDQLGSARAKMLTDAWELNFRLPKASNTTYEGRGVIKVKPNSDYLPPELKGDEDAFNRDYILMKMKLP